ncbi:hypothetical protein JGS22_008000 [Streptomyces sp. P38-E01]|uniref:Tetratricopeptide repeat protein n=1 Tax=Streptomyces tardus TaxID=2780544 RepID=A0A949JNX0_9ACTN|nr:hypothetical protein [Streptomyces tardus]MBU7597565.1 hypothetical protein [Streptomyces tardus]
MPPGVDLFEEHGEVAALWPQRIYHGRTVVCFDRHLDLKPLAPGGAEALRAAASAGEDPAALVRRLPVRGVPGAFGLDDFWTAAAIAGDLKSLVWVPSWRSHPGWWSTATDAVSLIAVRPTAPYDATPRDAYDATPRDAYVPHDSYDDAVDPAPRARACCLSVTLCGVRLAVVPPDLLAEHRRRHLRGDVVVDIDLDWLVDEHGRLDHEVDDLAELVSLCGGELSAMTWSTRSGFLPAEFRRVGRDVARRLGLRTRESSYLPATPWPEDVLLNVHRGVVPPEFTTDSQEPVAEGVAIALRGLAAAAHDPGAAHEAYERAAAHGYRSSWLAYRTGIAHYLAGDHGSARTRLRRAVEIDPADTLAMHARILAARATARIDGPRPALAELSSLARELPLRAGVWRTVRVLAEAVGEPELTQEAEGALRRIRRLGVPEEPAERADR